MATEFSTLTTCINCGLVTRKIRDDSTSHKSWVCKNCGVRDIASHTAVREASNSYSNPEKVDTMVRGYALDAVDAGTLNDVVDLVHNNGIVLPTKSARTSANAAVISESFAATSSVTATTLTYSMTGQPLNLTINSSTGLVTGTTHATTDGVYPTTVTVTDNLKPANTASVSFVWTIA